MTAPVGQKAEGDAWIVSFTMPESFAEHGAALRWWLTERGLRASGEPEVNRYDPPWTPWFMRRNEVWFVLD